MTIFKKYPLGLVTLSLSLSACFPPVPPNIGVNTTKNSPVNTPVTSDSNAANVPLPEQAPPVFENDEVTQMSPETLAAVSPEDIKTLTSTQITLLTSEQFKAMTPGQIGVLLPQQLVYISAEQFQQLSGEQLRAIPLANMAYLTVDQLEAFTPEQFAQLKPEQINALTTGAEDVAAPPELPVTEVKAGDAVIDIASIASGLGETSGTVATPQINAVEGSFLRLIATEGKISPFASEPDDAAVTPELDPVPTLNLDKLLAPADFDAQELMEDLEIDDAEASGSDFSVAQLSDKQSKDLLLDQQDRPLVDLKSRLSQMLDWERQYKSQNRGYSLGYGSDVEGYRDVVRKLKLIDQDRASCTTTVFDNIRDVLKNNKNQFQWQNADYTKTSKVLAANYQPSIDIGGGYKVHIRHEVDPNKAEFNGKKMDYNREIRSILVGPILSGNQKELNTKYKNGEITKTTYDSKYRALNYTNPGSFNNNNKDMINALKDQLSTSLCKGNLAFFPRLDAGYEALSQYYWSEINQSRFAFRSDYHKKCTELKLEGEIPNCYPKLIETAGKGIEDLDLGGIDIAKAIRNVDIQIYHLPNQISKISPNVISKLSTGVIASLSTKTLRGFTTKQIRALSVEQLNAINVNVVQGLSRSFWTRVAVTRFSGLSQRIVSKFDWYILTGISYKRFEGLNESYIDKDIDITRFSAEKLKSFPNNVFNLLTTNQILQFNAFTLANLPADKQNFVISQMTRLKNIAKSKLTGAQRAQVLQLIGENLALLGVVDEPQIKIEALSNPMSQSVGGSVEFVIASTNPSAIYNSETLPFVYKLRIYNGQTLINTYDLPKTTTGNTAVKLDFTNETGTHEIRVYCYRHKVNNGVTEANGDAVAQSQTLKVNFESTAQIPGGTSNTSISTDTVNGTGTFEGL